MDPETYRQSVSEGSAEAARIVAVLARVVIGAVVVAACLWVGWLGRASLVDRLNVFFARVGQLPAPRLPVRRVLNGFFGFLGGVATGMVFVVTSSVGWVARRRLTAVVTATATVGVGVYLAAFGVAGVSPRAYHGRVYRRYWLRTPDQMATTLAMLGSRPVRATSARRSRVRRPR